MHPAHLARPRSVSAAPARVAACKLKPASRTDKGALMSTRFLAPCGRSAPAPPSPPASATTPAAPSTSSARSQPISPKRAVVERPPCCALPAYKIRPSPIAPNSEYRPGRQAPREIVEEIYSDLRDYSANARGHLRSTLIVQSAHKNGAFRSGI